MKIQYKTILCSFLILSSFSIKTDEIIKSTLGKYKAYLIAGTFGQQDWRTVVQPKSRYHTFKKAFLLFAQNNGKTVVELGTTRSFVHGGHIGCNKDNPIYWTPNEPKNWDWGAGSFTRIAAECLMHLKPIIHTVDLEARHINRCELITAPFKTIMRYHVCPSERFLNNWNHTQKIDLLYLDTGDMTPIEPTAQLHLREAKIIVQRDLVAQGGLILIDDVRNQTPKKFGETSKFGKAKYSLPYFLQHGFEIIADEYQVLLRKKR